MTTTLMQKAESSRPFEPERTLSTHVLERYEGSLTFNRQPNQSPINAKKKGCMHPKVAQLLKRHRIKSNTPEWYMERGWRISATNVSTIIHKAPIRGENKYRNISKLLRQKHNVAPRIQNDACDHGVYYEPELLQAYEWATGNVLVKEDIGFLTGDDLGPQEDCIVPEYVGATPDGVCMYTPILVEGKCPFYKRDLTAADIDDIYYPQVQTQMAVTGFKMTHFVRYVPGSVMYPLQLEILEVPFDPVWWKAALPYLFKFFQTLCLAPCPPTPKQRRKRIAQDLPPESPTKKRKPLVLVDSPPPVDDYECETWGDPCASPQGGSILPDTPHYVHKRVPIRIQQASFNTRTLHEALRKPFAKHTIAPDPIHAEIFKQLNTVPLDQLSPVKDQIHNGIFQINF